MLPHMTDALRTTLALYRMRPQAPTHFGHRPRAFRPQALSLVHEQRNEFGVGAVVSYMQIDASKIADSLPYLHLTWSGPMLLVVATFMLYHYLGFAGLAGFGVMVGGCMCLRTLHAHHARRAMCTRHACRGRW